MAQVKITALTALTAADSASTDVLPVVDVSADATKKLAISDLHRSVPDGTLSAPGIAFQSDLNSGLYRSGTDAIALVTNGAARILIDATGDVTIPNNLTIQGATTYAFAAGTAAAPSITFVDDSDTGLYSPSANQVAVATNGTGRLFVDANGNVGVGITPTTRFHVYQTGSTQAGLVETSQSASVLNFKSTGQSSGQPQLGCAASDMILNTNGSERLRITSTGSVGIGTSSPGTTLDVNGDAAFSANVEIGTYNPASSDSRGIKLAIGTSGSTLFIQQKSSATADNASFAGYYGTSQTSEINADGSAYFASNVGIGTTSPINYTNYVTLALSDSSGSVIDWMKGSTLQGSIYNAGDNFYFEAKSSVPMLFATNGAERMRIDSSGNVGIGTSSPSQKLTAVGNIKIAGAQAGNSAKFCLTRTDRSWSINNETDLRFYTGSGDTDSPATATVVFTGGGNVGIGATSPAFSNGSGLEIQRDGVSTLRLEDSSGLGAVVEIFADDGSRSAIYDSRGNSSNHGHEFRVNGSPKVNINSSGNVGIGTTSPGRLLEVNNDGETFIRIKSSNTGNAGIEFGDQSDTVQGAIFQNSTDNSLRFNGYNNSEAMRIDSSGNVGIGTSSPTSIAGYTGVTINNATNGGFIDLQSNETAVFRFLTNGTVNNIETRTATPIVFLINTNERARIDSSGRLLVGVSSSSVANAAIFQGNSSGSDVGVVTIATETASPANGSLLGILDFSDNGHKRAARIECSRDGGTWTSNSSHPSRLAFYTTADGASSTTERMRIDSSGVIDFTGPGYTPSTNSCFIKQDSSGEGYLYNRGNNDLLFGTNNTERMRIDNSGRLLVGATSALAIGGESAAKLQLIDASATSAGWFNLARFANSAGANAIQFGKSRGTTVGDYTIVQNGDALGTITFAGADGTDLGSYGAQIQAQVDGTPGANDMPGRLVFSTTADGESSPTERMRIDSSGRVGIGTSSPSTLLHVSGGDITANQNLLIRGSDSNGVFIRNGANTAWNCQLQGNGNASFLGNVGIGTTSPQSKASFLTTSVPASNPTWSNSWVSVGPNVGSSTGAALGLGYDSSGDEAYLVSLAPGIAFKPLNIQANIIKFQAGSSGEDVRIDTSGRLLVGTSTSRNVGANTSGRFQLEQSAAAVSASIVNNVNAATGAIISLAKTRGSSTGSNTVVQNNDQLGELRFVGADGTSVEINAARIGCFVDGTPGSNDMPGRLVFSTTADGASSPTERMRIDSDGRLLIGGTSTADDNHADINANGVLTIRRAAASNDCIVIKEGSTESLLIEAAGNVYNYNVGSFAFTSWDNEFGTSGPYASLGSFGGEARITAGSTASDDVPLVFRTASSGTLNEEMRLLPGGGLTFNGDTAQANALDDYEEGTWTPTIRENGSGAAWDTIAANNGYYTKIGDCVTFSATFNYSGVATNVTGGFYGWLAGFPFASSSSKKSGQFFISFLYAGVRTVLYGGVFIGGNAYAGIHKDQDSTSPGTMMTNEYPTGAHTVKFQGHYYV